MNFQTSAMEATICKQLFKMWAKPQDVYKKHKTSQNDLNRITIVDIIKNLTAAEQRPEYQSNIRRVVAFVEALDSEEEPTLDQDASLFALHEVQDLIKTPNMGSSTVINV